MSGARVFTQQTYAGTTVLWRYHEIFIGIWRFPKNRGTPQIIPDQIILLLNPMFKMGSPILRHPHVVLYIDMKTC